MYLSKSQRVSGKNINKELANTRNISIFVAYLKCGGIWLLATTKKNAKTCVEAALVDK